MGKWAGNTLQDLQNENSALKTLVQLLQQANGRPINIIANEHLPPGAAIEAVTLGEAKFKANQAYEQGFGNGCTYTAAMVNRFLIPYLFAVLEANGAAQYALGVAIGGGFNEPSKQVIDKSLTDVGNRIVEADLKATAAREQLGVNGSIIGITDVYEALKEFAIGSDPEGQQLKARHFESNPVKSEHLEIQHEYGVGIKQLL